MLPLFGAVGGSELLSSDGSDGAELPFVVVVVVVIVANGLADAVRGGNPSSSSGCSSAATQCVQTANSTLFFFCRCETIKIEFGFVNEIEKKCLPMCRPRRVVVVLFLI